MRALTLVLLLTVAVLPARADDFRTLLEQVGPDDREGWKSICDAAAKSEENLSKLLVALADRSGPLGPDIRNSALQVRDEFAKLRPAFDANPERTKAALERAFGASGRQPVLAHVASWLGLAGDFPQLAMAGSDGSILSRVPEAQLDPILKLAEGNQGRAITALALHPARRARQWYWSWASDLRNRAHAEAYWRVVVVGPDDLELAVAALAKKPSGSTTLMLFLAERGHGADVKPLVGLSFGEPQLDALLPLARAGAGDEEGTKVVIARLKDAGADRRLLLAALASGARPEGMKAVAEAWAAGDRGERFAVLEGWLDSGDAAGQEAALAAAGEAEVGSLIRAGLARLCWSRPARAAAILPGALDSSPEFAAQLAPQAMHLWSAKNRVELMEAVLGLAAKDEKHREALLRVFESLDPWEIGWPFASMDEAREWWKANRERSASRAW